MNKTIKKIAAVAFGASMIVATAGAAMALDLSNYPAPFVTSGVFGGKIVIGEKAQTIDVAGAIDIAASLQRDASTAVAGASGTTSVQGGFRLDTSGDRIYYGDAFSVDSATGDNLEILKATQFEDDEGTVYDYTQSVVFSKSQTLTFGTHSASSSDVDPFLAFDLGTSASTTSYLYETKVNFNKAVNATNDNVKGNKITLFGNEYTFASESSSSQLVLYGAAQEVSMTTKDTVTKTIDGTNYEIKIIGFGGTTSKVVVSVNGVSDSITEGSSKTINGLKIYAKTITSWNNGADGYATLQLGAKKVVLKDGDNVKVGTAEKAVDGTYVDLGGDPTALTGIYIYINGNDDAEEIKETGSFTDPVYGSFKVSFADNTYPITGTRDEIKIKPSGSHKVQITVPVVGQTEAKTVTFDYDDTLAWESAGRNIYPLEGQALNESMYTYLAPADVKYTHLVKVKNIRVNAVDGYAEYEDVLTGATYKTLETDFHETNTALDLTVDGKTYVVTLTSNDTTNPTVSVAYADGYNVVYPEIELKGGERFTLADSVTLTAAWTSVYLPGIGNVSIPTYGNGNATWVPTGSKITYNYANTSGTVKTLALNTTDHPAAIIIEPKDIASVRNTIIVPTSYDSTNGVDGGTPVLSGTSASASMKDSDYTAYIDYFGTYTTKYNPTGYNDVVVSIKTPSSQMYANVFIQPLTAVATAASTGSVSLNPIAVGMAIFDSEATLGSKPYIVVGGPCANTVASALLANPTPCATGFTEGKAKIKLFATQNALLVAGFSGKDTQGASRVLANYKDYALTGTEVEVITTNLNTLSVNKVQ